MGHHDIDLSGELYAELRALDPEAVAQEIGLVRAKDNPATRTRERFKWNCPVCGSSDGLHINTKKCERNAVCYAGCGQKQHTPVDLAMAAWGCDVVRAAVDLARAFGVRAEREPATRQALRKWRASRQTQSSPQSSQSSSQSAERSPQSEEIWAWLYERLALADDAADYLEGRGLTFATIWEAGWRSCDAEAWADHLREACRRWGVSPVRRAGLINRDAPHPRADQFLVIPYWRPLEGAAASAPVESLRFRPYPRGRVLSPCGAANQPRLPWGQWWAIEAARATRLPLVVVEGEIDALSVAQAGLPCVAAPGWGSWEASWCESWRDLSLVIVTGDGDEGGERLRERVREGARASLGEEWVLDRLHLDPWAAGADANDALLSGELLELVPAWVERLEEPQDWDAVRRAVEEVRRCA